MTQVESKDLACMNGCPFDQACCKQVHINNSKCIENIIKSAGLSSETYVVDTDPRSAKVFIAPKDLNEGPVATVYKGQLLPIHN